ncbi:MAG: sugar ABC transporter ATP-binding protein [bacterium]|nr:sugar ABC transporter ATP-binding protein [bacterium]
MKNSDETILEVKQISKEFPGVKALDAVDLTLKKGEVHALCGENGAGKSTLIKILAGVYPKDSGEILFDGQPIQIHTALDSLRLGIKVVFQELALIPSLSVAENVFLESFPLKKNKTIDWKILNNKTHELVQSVGLDLNPTQKISTLTVSQQQMVEIARALSHEARVVIMDEPTSALTPNEIKSLFTVIRKLRNLGIGILYVTHKLEEVFELCDRVTVLRDGKLISTRVIADTDSDKLVSDMVGREFTALFPRTHSGRQDRTVLQVRGVSTEKKLNDVSFDVHAGEVVGVFGLMGAGRTELAKAIFGLDPVTAGDVLVNEQKLKAGSTTHAARVGMGLLTEDRKAEGLVLQMSVTQNMTLPSVKDFASYGFIRGKAETDRSREFVDKFSIKTPSLRQKVEYLSGGNQQKVLLARWLMKKLQVIILDEPTRGIDVGAKAEIHKLIDELAETGLAVLVMTSEMPELLGVSDRILVMSNGRLTGEFEKQNVTQEKILEAAIA